MNFDLSKEIKDLDEVVLNRKDKDGNDIPVTLDYVVREALFAQFSDEKADWEEKEKRYKLAVKIKESPAAVDLKSEEISLLKKLVGKGFGANVVGRLSEALGL